MSKEAKYLTIIEAGRTEMHYWKDLWRFRELFLFYSWKDILVRYKQTVMGVAWSVLRPLLAMVVFTYIFGSIANLPSDGVPYPILVYSAMLPWQFFANSFSEASNSLVGNANIITKIYFPRLIIPTSSVIVSMVDILISFVILAVIMLIYRYIPPVQMVTIPIFFFIALLISLGGGYLVAALNVQYRDFKYVVPFIVQFGLFVSPVGFSSSVIPEKWRLLYSINPMVGVIDGFRWAILGGTNELYYPSVIISIVLSFIIFLLGIWYFRRVEKTFADVI